MDESTGTALELVNPLKDGYAEGLVCFHRPNEALAAQRVQWSTSSGFIETDFRMAGRPDDTAGDADPGSPLSKGS